MEMIYTALQREAAKNGGMMGETALLEAGQAIGVLVQRNIRLGINPYKKNWKPKP